MEEFQKLLKERILVLDGAMGTMIQSYRLTEKDFRGDLFSHWSSDLRGNNDLLNLTRPDVIAEIARKYLNAGADIITTNTFNGNAISMEDYGMEDMVAEINRAGAKIARSEADSFMQLHPDRKIWVAGSMGPTNKTASMSPDVNDPGFRAVTYDDLFTAYATQIRALMEGGVDLLLFETIFDSLNLKAGLDAAMSVMEQENVKIPLMLSLTLSGHSGRTFSGQTLKAFLASVEHAPITTIGLNCSFGAEDMKVYLAELAKAAPYPISCHPNAGLPNAMGEYDETPEKMARHIADFVEEGLVNIVGGCCGTTPDHIARYPDIVRGKRPHRPTQSHAGLWLSGLELVEVKPENRFINVGERCNVAGSRKFLRLIKEKNYDEAMAIARKQVEDGAGIIDINMDDGMLDAVEEVTTFLNLMAAEPDIACVPVMIDSSKWEVIEAGLKCVQGKSIVNSISLKEGEEKFLEHARRIRRLGAATVVMAFDEEGQADTFERKTAICGRAYRLLTEKAGFDPENIIFDPNILAIATGIEEHNRYGLDFIRAVKWIKTNLPGAKVSGGVSNLSFSFRGNNYLREAMHSVFLYHAISSGMDMAILNPATSVTYEEIDPSLRSLIEDVILYRRPEAAEELIAYAQHEAEKKSAGTDQNHDGHVKTESWRTLPVDDRLTHALVKGIADHLDEDIAEALTIYSDPVSIIDGPLMKGMNKVGTLFGEGKMFLPQVVKTARTMKKAVTILQPHIEAKRASASAKKAGKVVFATVKGDVHDIGKNIVSIVLACNNYEVIDLGVMVPAEEIVRTAIREKPDLVCLSGLITPSLDEMVHVTDEMERAGLDIPIMVGGATTSRLHTAIKIAPHYSSPVIHVPDASQNPLIAARLLNSDTRDEFIKRLNEEYTALRARESGRTHTFIPLEEARRHAMPLPDGYCGATAPSFIGRRLINISVSDVVPYINWRAFFTAWKLSGEYASLSHLHDCPSCRRTWIDSFQASEQPKAQQALELYDDALSMLSGLTAADNNTHHLVKAAVTFVKASKDGDNLIIGDVTIPTLRQQSANADGICRSLVDFVSPTGDYLGAFVITVDAEDRISAFEREGDSYRALLLQTLTHRLTEAASEYLHAIVRRDLWGYSPDENLSVEEMYQARYQGIRPAVGYPSLPDQKINHTLDRLLGMSELGVTLTENGAMHPSSTVSGLYFAAPHARYFMIGEIDDEQLSDYAVRRGISVDEARVLLNRNTSRI